MEVGGGLDSHEDRNYPGFWHNIHSVFHRGLMMLPWYKDLELENFGIHYYRPDPGVVHHFLDKTYLGWFADVKKTVETIERFLQERRGVVHGYLDALAAGGAKDRLYRNLCRAAAVRREEAAARKDSRRARVSEIFRHHAGGIRPAPLRTSARARFYRLSSASCAATSWTRRKTGYLIPAMIAWGVNPQLCRGTSHALGDNLAHMMSHNQRRLYRGQRRRADSRRERPGDRGRARRRHGDQGAQVHRFQRQSGGDLHQVGRAGESGTANSPTLADNFRFSKTTPIFATNLALNERPKYITEEKHPEVAGSFMHIVGLEEYEDLVNLFEDCRTGQLPRKPFMNGATPSYPRSDPGAAGQSHCVHVAAHDLQSLGQPAELGQGAR